MNRYLRYVLIIFAAVTLLLLGLILYIAAIFDPNTCKPQIIQLVKDKKQRELRLDGDIKLSFFPSLGAELNNLSLSEHDSSQEFASAEKAFVSLALMPLLRRELVAREIGITGLKANLTRYRDGRTNIDDLIARSEVPERFKFVIDHVHVERSTLAFHDEASESRLTFRDFDLKADKADAGPGPVDNAIRSRMELGFGVNQSDQPDRTKLDVATRIKFGLTFNPDKRFYAVDGLHLISKGRIDGIRNLVANLTGDFSLDFATDPADGEFAARGLVLGVTGLVDGTSGESNLDVKLDAPRLNLTGEHIAGDKMTLMAKVTHPSGSTSGTVSFSDVQGTLNDFMSRALTLEAEYKKEGAIVRTLLVSPLAGNFTTRQLNLPDITVSIDMINPANTGLPGHTISGRFNGSATLDGLAENGQAHLNGSLEDSNVEAEVTAINFVQPNVDFKVNIDQLDLDRLLSVTKEQKSSAVKAAGAKIETLPGLSLLNDLEELIVRGKIRIGLLKTSNVRLSGVKLDIAPDRAGPPPG